MKATLSSPKASQDVLTTTFISINVDKAVVTLAAQKLLGDVSMHSVII